MSLALAPNAISTSLDNAVSTMSPLTIGMEGLTEQQAAEVVELLTPFLSPAATPSFTAANAAHGFISHPATPLILGQAMAEQQQQQQQQQFQQVGGNVAGRANPDEAKAFSPLTSPALLPQQATGTSAAGSSRESMAIDPHKTQHQLSLSLNSQQQQQGGASIDTAMSMPPPSPSITAEHIMRRQQQMLLEKHAAAASSVTARIQQSPSFPSSSGAAATHLAGASGNNGSIRNRRNTATSITNSGSTHITASPHHHPYRMPHGYKKQGPNAIARSPLVNSSQAQAYAAVAAAAVAATTPILMSNPSSAAAQMGMDKDEFHLDPLPDSALVSAAAAAVVASLQNTPVLQYSVGG
ncbi:hypothetical protein GGI12_005052, partial [Dipsacomyces acuminosporus]